jgi:hypothetical protein
MRHAWLVGFSAVTMAVAIGAASAPASSIDSALGAWLPDPEAGFGAWSKGQTARTTVYDYFVCGSERAPSVGKENFDYAGGACPLVKNGTAFAYGTAGPIKGSVLYDRDHEVAFYYKGCCAWRGFALTSKLEPPPKPVNNANLSAVHTMRGVRLGMTQARVEQVYGAARSHPAKGLPGATTLSYTTMKGTPKNSSEACGQFQSFSFENDRLISIELLIGC